MRPGSTRRSTPSTACTAPKRTDRPVASRVAGGRASVARSSARRAVVATGRRRRSGWRPRRASVSATPFGCWMRVMMRISPDAMIRYRSRFSTFAGEQRDGATRYHERRHDGTADVADAPDHAERHEVQRRERVELGVDDGVEAKGHQHAADAGDRGGDREGVDLHGRDADPERRRGPLVAADGEHPPADASGAQVDEGEGDEPEDDDDERGEALGVDRRPQVDPEQGRRLDAGAAEAADEVRVAEDHRLDGERQAERGDGQRAAPAAQRRHGEREARHDSGDDSERGDDRERPAPQVAGPSGRPPAEAGDRELAE